MGEGHTTDRVDYWGATCGTLPTTEKVTGQHDPKWLDKAIHLVEIEVQRSNRKQRCKPPELCPYPLEPRGDLAAWAEVAAIRSACFP
jgi:hypothetical protein